MLIVCLHSNLKEEFVSAKTVNVHLNPIVDATQIKDANAVEQTDRVALTMTAIDVSLKI